MGKVNGKDGEDGGGKGTANSSTEGKTGRTLKRSKKGEEQFLLGNTSTVPYAPVCNTGVAGGSFASHLPPLWSLLSVRIYLLLLSAVFCVPLIP